MVWTLVEIKHLLKLLENKHSEEHFLDSFILVLKVNGIVGLARLSKIISVLPVSLWSLLPVILPGITKLFIPTMTLDPVEIKKKNFHI